MAEFPAPKEGIVLTHFIVSNDVERSRRFYTEVLGGELVRDGEPSIVALANSWIIINVGGGPTDDKQDTRSSAAASRATRAAAATAETSWGPLRTTRAPPPPRPRPPRPRVPPMTR
jgi:catechol 2,3-dioxygenase-like lactoylglutathione lyase family enzyme